MRKGLLAVCAMLICIGQPLWAQPPKRDPVKAHVFPPELVMQHQKEIALSEEQKKSFKEEIRKAQAEFIELEWNLQDQVESFVSLLSRERVEEEKTLAQLGKVLALEAQIKRKQLRLAIRLKNLLSPEQQTRLQEIRKQDSGSSE